jgi:hypothetical protein
MYNNHFMLKHDLLLCIKIIQFKYNNFLSGSIQIVLNLKSFIIMTDISYKCTQKMIR